MAKKKLIITFKISDLWDLNNDNSLVLFLLQYNSQEICPIYCRRIYKMLII